MALISWFILYLGVAIILLILIRIFKEEFFLPAFQCQAFNFLPAAQDRAYSLSPNTALAREISRDSHVPINARKISVLHGITTSRKQELWKL